MKTDRYRGRKVESVALKKLDFLGKNKPQSGERCKKCQDANSFCSGMTSVRASHSAHQNVSILSHRACHNVIASTSLKVFLPRKNQKHLRDSSASAHLPVPLFKINLIIYATGTAEKCKVRNCSFNRWVYFTRENLLRNKFFGFFFWPFFSVDSTMAQQNNNVPDAWDDASEEGTAAGGGGGDTAALTSSFASTKFNVNAMEFVPNFGAPSVSAAAKPAASELDAKKLSRIIAKKRIMSLKACERKQFWLRGCKVCVFDWLLDWSGDEKINQSTKPSMNQCRRLVRCALMQARWHISALFSPLRWSCPLEICFNR